MKILVNASTCVLGGGGQVAANFIKKSFYDSKHVFQYAISPLVQSNLGECARDRNLLVLPSSPAKPWKGASSRSALKDMERSFKPDLVFTVFGPAYQEFEAPHICGIADPWLTHRSSIATSMLGYLSYFKMIAKCRYMKFRLSKSDHYWTETETSKKGIVRVTDTPPDNVRVIPNCYSDIFEGIDTPNPDLSEKIRVFILAAPHPQKNLGIIPHIASVLKSDGFGDKYVFIVTLPDKTTFTTKFIRSARRLGVEGMIENAGVIPLFKTPDWYASIQLVLMPTLLETFSVTYLEAMKMRRAIVTTDIDFAHDICADAAAYYSPLSPQKAADLIKRLAENRDLYNELVTCGIERLRNFPTPDEKYKLHIEWCEVVAGK